MQISPIANSLNFGHVSTGAIRAFRAQTEGFQTEIKRNEDGKYLAWSYSSDEDFQNLSKEQLKTLDNLTARAQRLQKTIIGPKINPARNWIEDKTCPYCEHFTSSDEGISVFSTRPSTAKNFTFVKGDANANLEIFKEAVEYAEGIERNKKAPQFNMQNYNKGYNHYFDRIRIPKDRFKAGEAGEILERTYLRTIPVDFKYYISTCH